MSEFRGVIAWRDIEEHLRRRIDAAIADLDKAETDRAIGRAQGQIAAFRALLNLPETLSLTAAAAKEVEKHG
jgi:hypothetical protein